MRYLKLLAIIPAVLMVLLLPLSLLAHDIGRVVFDPPTVKAVVAEEVLRADPIPLALQWFSRRQAEVYTAQAHPDPNREPSIFEILSYATLEDWRRIRDEVLPDEFVIAWVNTAVDGTYTWIDSEERVPQIVFDLRAFRERLNSEHGRNAVLLMYNALPPCTPEQIEDFRKRQDAAPPGVEVPYNVCQFPAPWHEDQVNDYANSVQRIVENIPDTFDLTTTLAAEAENPQGIGPEAIKAQLRTLRAAAALAPLVPFVLLALTLLLAVRSLSDFGLWWGVPLGIGGLLTLIPAVTYRPLLTSYLLTGPLSEAPQAIRDNALHAGLRLSELVFAPLRNQAIWLLALGLGGWLLTRLLKGRRRT